MTGSSDSTLFAATTLSSFNKCFSNSRPLQASERKGGGHRVGKKSQHIEWDKTIRRDLSLNESLRRSFRVEGRETSSPIGWNIYSIMNSYILLCAVKNDWVVCIRQKTRGGPRRPLKLRLWKKKSVHEELYPKLCLAGGSLEINNSCLSSPYEVPVQMPQSCWSRRWVKSHSSQGGAR